MAVHTMYGTACMMYCKQVKAFYAHTTPTPSQDPCHYAILACWLQEGCKYICTLCDDDDDDDDDDNDNDDRG